MVALLADPSTDPLDKQACPWDTSPTWGNGLDCQPIYRSISWVELGVEAYHVGLSLDATHRHAPHVTDPKDFEWPIIQITETTIYTNDVIKSNGPLRSAGADHGCDPVMAWLWPSIHRVTRSASALPYKCSKP